MVVCPLPNTEVFQPQSMAGYRHRNMADFRDYKAEECQRPRQTLTRATYPPWAYFLREVEARDSQQAGDRIRLYLPDYTVAGKLLSSSAVLTWLLRQIGF